MKENRTVQIRYHLIFWMVYIILWSSRDLIYHPELINNIVLNSIFSLAVAPFIYFHIFFLVPKFLLKKKLALYATYFGINFLIMFVVRYLIYQFILDDVLGLTETAARFRSGDGYVILISENVVILMITLALYLIQEWFVKERYTHELEQKNVESELSMLKSQLQPHFLFNNLNTIYFLMETNPTLAKEVMIQFSDVLSHQLYNAQKDKVPLKEELDSLENFLKIQMVRHEDFLKLDYKFPQNTGEHQVAPMILLTFIENAFKHGQREDGYHIYISLDLKEKDLHLHVANSNGNSAKDKKGGVGLENVRRRLSLIYPNRHKLEIKETKETYTVDLTLTLDQNGKA